MPITAALFWCWPVTCWCLFSDNAGCVFNSFFILVQTCSLLVTVLDIAGRAYNGRFILVLTCGLSVCFFQTMQVAGCGWWVPADPISMATRSATMVTLASWWWTKRSVHLSHVSIIGFFILVLLVDQFMYGTFQAVVAFQDSDIFQKERERKKKWCWDAFWVWFLTFQDSNFNLVPPLF